MRPVSPLPVYRRTRRIHESDLDALGHVNNLVWLRFVVELADAHSRAVGLDLETLRGLGGVWVVHRHEIDYHRDAGAGEEVREETWVSVMRGARSVRHARIHRAASGELLVSATSRWAFVDAVHGRPCRIPPVVLERFVPLETPPD